MGFLSIKGTITAYGNMKVEQGITRYDSVTISEDRGIVTHIRKVKAQDPMNSYIQLGSSGEFFFHDKEFYGVKTSDGIVDYTMGASSIGAFFVYTILTIGAFGLSIGAAASGAPTFGAIIFAFFIGLLIYIAVDRSRRAKQIRKHFTSSSGSSGEIVRTRTI